MEILKKRGGSGTPLLLKALARARLLKALARAPGAVIPKPAQPRGARASGFLSSRLSSRSFQCLLRGVGSACVCCMLRHRSYVASCVWRLCRVAHWLSRTMLRACCCLCAARCSPHTECGDAVCFLVASRMCSRPLACRLLTDARCPLHAVRCLFHVACGLLRAACCMLHVACCLALCMSVLFATYCPLHGACCLDVVCCTRVVRRIFPVAFA
jgi:hypothetical protein